MKVGTQERRFEPVTITIENQRELEFLVFLIGNSSDNSLTEIANSGNGLNRTIEFTSEDANRLTSMYVPLYKELIKYRDAF